MERGRARGGPPGGSFGGSCGLLEALLGALWVSVEACFGVSSGLLGASMEPLPDSLERLQCRSAVLGRSAGTSKTVSGRFVTVLEPPGHRRGRCRATRGGDWGRACDEGADRP